MLLLFNNPKDEIPLKIKNSSRKSLVPKFFAHYLKIFDTEMFLQINPRFLECFEVWEKIKNNLCSFSTKYQE